MSTAQRHALNNHRRRRRDGGIVRVEVQAPSAHAALIRNIAAVLRGEDDAARAMRFKLQSAVSQPRAASVFDIFGAELDDAAFEGVFDAASRLDLPRDVDL